jgi:hypothetical protein
MDPSQVVQLAGEQQPAAPMNEAEAYLQADGGFFKQPEPAPQEAQPPQQPETPGAETPPIQADGSAPIASEPITPAEPETDWRKLAEDAQKRNAEFQAQFDQIAQLNQTQIQRQQAAAAEQQRQEQIANAYQIAQQLEAQEPGKGMQYIRQFEDWNRLQQQQQMQYMTAAQQQQFRQQFEVAVAPQYAQHLVQVNGLPDDYVPILAQYDGRTQDRLVKDFALQHRRNVEAKSTMDAQTEQRLRDLEAQIKQQSGGFTPSSTGSGSPPAQSDRPTDPRAREVWDYLHAGQ